MKLESHCDKILLELGYSAVVNVLLPIATMTSNHTPASGPGRNDRFGEFLRKLEVRGADLHPDQIDERCMDLRSSDAELDAVLGAVETILSTLAGDEQPVTLVNVGG